MANAMDETTAQAIENTVDVATTIGFKRLTEEAVIPTRAFTTDSGFDLVASEDVIIEPGETTVVPTGIAVHLPEGFEAVVRPRSGVTSKTDIRVQLGTIDNGYAGEIGVIVDNIAPDIHGKMLNHDRLLTVTNEGIEGRCPYGTYMIRKNDRIAQLVIQRLPHVEAVEVFDIGESDRGSSGFGSSGVNTKGSE